MRFNDCPGDCQPQTRAADSPAAGQVGPIEAIEDVGKVFRVDADPIIGDRNCQTLLSFKLRRNHNVAARFGTMNGVVHDVPQCLALSLIHI